MFLVSGSERVVLQPPHPSLRYIAALTHMLYYYSPLGIGLD